VSGGTLNLTHSLTTPSLTELAREDRQKCVGLVREKRLNTERIEDLRERVRIMLEKKFGRQVSIAKLESLIINPYMVELHQDQHDFAVACAKELKEWNVRAFRW